MSLALCLVVAAAAAPARDLLLQVHDDYHHLTAFSMRIEHQDSSGLFPGAYTQRLRWRRGGRFELVVTAGGDRRVPDYYADGQQLLMIRPGNLWSSEALQPGPNMMPGWEVSGGPILGWLQETPTSRFFLDPPREMALRWEIGPRATWHGRAVRELRAVAPGQKSPLVYSLFVDARRPLLVGTEAFLNGKTGWELYADQQLNPPLPASLGDAPAAPAEPKRGKSAGTRRASSPRRPRSALLPRARPAPRAAAAGSLPRVREGQEWRYTGSVRVSGGERPAPGAEHSYVTTVTVVGQAGGRPEVARFRQTGNTPFRPAASVAWLAASREDGVPAPEAAGIEPGVRLIDALPLPVPFGARRGERWISRAPWLGLSPPFPQTVPFRHRVLGVDRVRARRCWRIERTLAAPLPLTAWVTRVLAYRELFWVDPRRGVLLKYQGSARFQDGPENAPVTTVTAALEWQGVRTLPAAAVRERREQARLLTEAADQLFSRSGTPGEVRLQQAQARLGSFRQRYPTGVYAPAARALGELARAQLAQIEQGQALARQQTALVGKPAPPLALKDLAGKEHTLGEYRGKLILLNVFASW